MTKRKRSRQPWWQLDGLMLMMVGFLFFAHHLVSSPGWRTFLEVGVLGVGFGLMAWWLETHPNLGQQRSSVEVGSSVVKRPMWEISDLLSSHVQVHFYVYSDPAIIYGEPEHPAGSLSLNGHHHPAKIIPSLPEEVAE
jgi:hypothetical protein